LRGIKKDRKGQIFDVFSGVFFQKKVLLHAKTSLSPLAVTVALFMRHASTLMSKHIRPIHGA
jgi:hypothetical protein